VSHDDAGPWEDQGGVTLFASVRPEAVNDLKKELARIQAQVETDGTPFSRSSRIHYARFVFVPEALDPTLGHCGPALMYLGDFDGPREQHLDELVHIAAAELGRLSPFFAVSIPPDIKGCRQWLEQHIIPDATHYVNAIGRTVRQIRAEAMLRDRIEQFLDGVKPAPQDPEVLRRQVQDFVRSERSLQWALKPVRDTRWRIKRAIARTAIILIGVPVAIITSPLLILWALLIRWYEKKESGDPPQSEPAHVAALAEREDHTLQNQFSALSFRKASWIRLVTPVVFLRLARTVVRYFFDTDNLAGLKTIHFARWTFIDGKRRLLFTSNYDGSHENYMGDFIDIVAWGLNASFSHGPEYPATRWLILDGAWNERSFKRHNRNKQIPTQVWYSAYPNLSAVNIAENARVRAGLFARQNPKQTKDWLRLLRRDWGRPRAKPVALERDDMQGLLVRGHSHHQAACFYLLGFADGEEGAAAAKRWLQSLLADTGVMMDGSATRHDRYAHIAFSHEGLRRLGCDESLLNGFSNEFRFGMTTDHRSRLLGDRGSDAPTQWKWGYPGQPLHAVLLLYARDKSDLSALRARYEGSFTRHSIAAEPLETSSFENKEHFGFRDGITTPIIEGLGRGAEPGLCIKPGEFILGYQNEYNRYPASPLIHRALDPKGHLKLDVEGSGLADFGRNGSYLVFRQLRQDVHGFWAFMDKAARELDGTSGRREWLAAKMVGRWMSGTPLVLAPNEDDPKVGPTDGFMFHKWDREGIHCPIGAHIRRTNPRDSTEPRPGSLESLSLSNRHRLLRRGRTYGDRLVESMDPEAILARGDDGQERGLHFICLNANIARQFEFVQSSWSNNPQFRALHDEVDPLTGERGRFRPDAEPATTDFTIPHIAGRTRIRGIPSFVTVRGGAYFFMPGMCALRYLAGLSPP
jgi:Dyp-type peroxidase family